MMKPTLQPMSRLGRIRRAFTVVELLVTVSILSVIVLTLYKVFDQTQRALHSNVNQTDVLESARAAMELITRELQGMAPSGVGAVNDTANSKLPVWSKLYYQTNFYVTNNASQLVWTVNSLGGTTPLRTNSVQDFFFFTRYGNDVSGIGYRVYPASSNSAIAGFAGTLFRYEANLSYFAKQPDFDKRSVTNLARFFLLTNNLCYGFLRARPFSEAGVPDLLDPVNFARVIDGVVHLSVTAYDAKGRPMNWNSVGPKGKYTLRVSPSPADNDAINSKPYLNSFYGVRPTSNGTNWFNDPNDANYITIRVGPTLNDGSGRNTVSYLSNALPAFVEVELGILDSSTLSRLRAFPDTSNGANQAAKFLANQAGKVHIFRQRVPIRASSQ